MARATYHPVNVWMATHYGTFERLEAARQAAWDAWWRTELVEALDAFAGELSAALDLPPIPDDRLELLLRTGLMRYARAVATLRGAVRHQDPAGVDRFLEDWRAAEKALGQAFERLVDERP